MGEAKRRQISDKALLASHRDCIYCGRPATSLDHFPPRSMFRDRVWPSGYAFPACAECNTGNGGNEQVVSFIARLKVSNEKDDVANLPLLKGIAKYIPEIIEEWQSEVSRNDLRKDFRRTFGVELGDALRRRGYTLLTTGPKTDACMHAFGDKLLRALFFQHIGRRADGPVFSTFISSLQQRKAVNMALESAPIFQETERNRVSLTDQFAYRYDANPSLGFIYAVVQLGIQVAYIGHALSSHASAEMVKHTPDALEQMEEFYRRMNAAKAA